MKSQTDDNNVAAFSIDDFCRWAAIGRTAAYDQIKQGLLQARKCGRRTIILRVDAERWLENLPSLHSVTERAEIRRNGRALNS